MRRTACSACKHPGLDEFLNLGMSPIADAYTETADAPVDKYPLELAVCNKCWLVQLLEVVDPKILFGTGYSFYTSASPPLSRYHAKYAANVLSSYRDLATKFTLEIGCNDGDLLRHFDEAGCRTMGVDPAPGPVAVARSRGLDIRTRPFSSAFAKEIYSTYGRIPLIIANHVLAHVADVSDILAGISRLLADDGVAIIEVQYLPDLLINNAFDLVYHEHRNFFSLTSLESAALRHGLHVIGAITTPRQGGSLRVTLSKQKPPEEVYWFKDHEQWLQGSGPYEGFQGRVDRIVSRLWEIITDEGLVQLTFAGYGAPAKATTLLNYCNIDSHVLDFVTDTTVAKQGRYIPGTGIPIVSPSNPDYDTGTYLLLAWNYMTQILRKEMKFTQQGGRWVIPVPAPVLL